MKESLVVKQRLLSKHRVPAVYPQHQIATEVDDDGGIRWRYDVVMMVIVCDDDLG